MHSVFLCFYIRDLLVQLVKGKAAVTKKRSILVGDSALADADGLSMLDLVGFADDRVTLFGAAEIIIATADSDHHLPVRDDRTAAGGVCHGEVHAAVGVHQRIEIIGGNSLGDFGVA